LRIINYFWRVKNTIAFKQNQELTNKYHTYFNVRIIRFQRVMDKKLSEKFGDPENCPVRNVIDRIGSKWSVLILLVLEEGEVLRFNEVYEAISTISQKMLSVTLKSLESDGLINRTVYPQIPPRVEYRLTERGKSLIPHLRNLIGWAKENLDVIRISRDLYMNPVAAQ
jgi:DNA-binding HxlR family transcriptional regulator